MAKIIQSSPDAADAAVQQIKNALDEYEKVNPTADASLYRRNSSSIRLRVIDRRFEGMTKSRRHDDVWTFLAERLPADLLAEVSLLLAVAPGELKSSLMNLEFDSPQAPAA